MAKDEDRSERLGVRVAFAYAPAIITAHLMARWLPKPFAWGTSAFLWLLVSYWIPPPSKKRFGRWLAVVLSASIVVWLLVKLQPDWY